MDFQNKEEKLIFAFVILFVALTFVVCCLTFCIFLSTANQQTNNIYQQNSQKDTVVSKTLKGIELKPIIKSTRMKNPNTCVSDESFSIPKEVKLSSPE